MARETPRAPRAAAGSGGPGPASRGRHLRHECCLHIQSRRPWLTLASFWGSCAWPALPPSSCRPVACWEQPVLLLSCMFIVYFTEYRKSLNSSGVYFWASGSWRVLMLFPGKAGKARCWAEGRQGTCPRAVRPPQLPARARGCTGTPSVTLELDERAHRGRRC